MEARLIPKVGVASRVSAFGRVVDCSVASPHSMFEGAIVDSVRAADWDISRHDSG
jgi:hypothetical protein